MYKYQWEQCKDLLPAKDIRSFYNSFGPQVIKRNKEGIAKLVRFNVYYPEKNAKIYLVGPFNGWGQKTIDQYELKQNEDNYSIEITDVKHKTPYGFRIGDQILRDPGSIYFDIKGDSLFWDFEDPSTYKFKYPKTNQFTRATKILQTDLPGLIYHYANKQGRKGKEVSTASYYKFITDSGVISKIKTLGFNAIQFLPINQSIDGDKWSFRYLVPFIYAINNRWGTPDDFAKMVDEFHKHDIAIILDQVISHAPHKDFSLFGFSANSIGIHKWQTAKKKDIFLDEDTYWGTKRYNYNDKNVRKFVIEAALSFVKNYNIDGFRIDNVDGIIREGINGDGTERKNGRTLLRELTQTIYDYAPETIFHFEAHYFHGNNAKWLVTPLNDHPKALGATAYTSSRLTYYLHTELMPKSADDISPWKIRDIISEKEWGQSNSEVADFHNHDAAAGLMPMRATGSYAYDALTLNNPNLHFHAIGKLKVMEALISFGMEGRTLDLLQTFLLQKGTFEHDSSIHWHLENNESTQGMLNFKQKVNKILDDQAFWPVNVNHREYINVDEKSKTLVIHRGAGENKHGFIVLINMSAFITSDFVIPTLAKSIHKCIFNSDELKYAGTGQSQNITKLKPEKVELFESFEYGLRLPIIAPYAVYVFKF